VTPRGSASGEPVRLLLVEDDPELVEMLTALLDEEGYRVDSASDGQRGLHLGMTRHYDLLVLDRGLPVVDGLDLLSGLRRQGVTTPILVLSALSTPADRVAGLDAGAEDYLGKPFDIDELLARLRALRRRHLDTSAVLPVGSRRLNLDTREVTAADPDATEVAPQPVRLSERECELLATLAARPGQVFTREQLLDRVFVDADNPVVVDTYVHYLRRKLGRDAVVTIRGRGYQLGANRTHGPA
jgi:two-component system, OmpR family, response regulator QseB